MTFKGAPFTPVQMAARSLCVLAEVLLPKFLDLPYKAKKSKTKNIVEHIRGLGKTVAEKRAIEGQGLDPPAAGLMGPMTAEEMVENRRRLRSWRKRLRSWTRELRRRIRTTWPLIRPPSVLAQRVNWFLVCTLFLNLVLGNEACSNPCLNLMISLLGRLSACAGA